MTEIEPWWMGRLKSFHPQMSLTVAAPTEVVLADLAAALKAHRFKTLAHDARSVATRRIDYLGFLAGSIDWTTMDVVVVDPGQPGSGPTTVTAEGGFQGSDPGHGPAAKALSSAVASWRSRGIAVSWTPWEGVSKEERKARTNLFRP